MTTNKLKASHRNSMKSLTSFPKIFYSFHEFILCVLPNKKLIRIMGPLILALHFIQYP